MSTTLDIRVNRPYTVGTELRYVAEALQHGHAAGDGPFTRRCERWIEQALGVSKVLLTTSCTDALEMAALLLDISAGDEVIVPAFTFVSTPNAFVVHGATPVFVDVRPDTLCLDETLLEARITPRTRAVVPVHYAGVACDMDRIGGIAASHGVAVVEDNAHGLLGAFRGRPLGTFGALAAQSFHETKNFTCGEGGALVITDPQFAQRAEILREKGTDRSRFLRGEVDKYTWVDVGSSFLPSDLLAAVLWAQLEAAETIQPLRRRIWERYAEGLERWAATRDVALPAVPSGCTSSYHLFHLMMPSADARQELIDHLRERGVQAVFHYQPLHLSPMGRRFGGRPGDCPVTEWASERILRLPFHTGLTEAEQAYVLEAVTAWR